MIGDMGDKVQSVAIFGHLADLTPQESTIIKLQDQESSLSLKQMGLEESE